MAYEKLKSIWRRRGLTELEIQQKLKQKQEEGSLQIQLNNNREQSQSQNKGGRPRTYKQTIHTSLRIQIDNYNYLKNQNKPINRQINQIIKREAKENDKTK